MTLADGKPEIIITPEEVMTPGQKLIRFLVGENKKDDLLARIKVGGEVGVDPDVVLVEEMIRLLDEMGTDEETPGVITQEEVDGLADLYISRLVEEVTPDAFAGGATRAVNGLRKNMASICRQEGASVRLDGYESGSEFSPYELAMLANRWRLPLVIFGLNHGHYRLVLKPPIVEEGKMRVLAYDPLGAGEDWIDLLGWPSVGELQNGALCVAKYGLTISTAGFEAIGQGNYDLSFPGDEKRADPIYQAKSARTQRDSYNCGPYSLVMAAFRAAFKNGFEEFKTIGVPQIKTDVGEQLLTREMIFR